VKKEALGGHPQAFQPNLPPLEFPPESNGITQVSGVKNQKACPDFSGSHFLAKLPTRFQLKNLS
jgi:hypothetical protein